MSTSFKRDIVDHWFKSNVTVGSAEVETYRIVARKSGGSSEDRPVGLFSAIEKSIAMLPHLPEDDENYLCSEAAEKALLVLSVLRHANVPPPRIIPEDPDALSFTWDSSELKRFLTVALDEVDVTHVHRPTKSRARRAVNFGDKIRAQDVFSAIGAAPINRSMSIEE